MGERTVLMAGQIVTESVPAELGGSYASVPIEIQTLGGNYTAFLPSGLKYCSMPADGSAGVLPVRAVTGQTLPVSGTVNVSELMAANSAANKLASYRAVKFNFGAGGYGAYATPTDLINIAGSNSKRILLTYLAITCQATAGSAIAFNVIKRNTPNSGGTYTVLDAIPNDSTLPAAAASLKLYTAAPTLGNAVGSIAPIYGSITTLTAQPGAFSMSTWVPVTANGTTEVRTGLILNNADESISLNFNGAILPAGFSAGYAIEWIEF